MAQASKRPMPREPAMYVDDEPSMPLELFGYHCGGVDDGDDTALPHLDFRGGCGGGSADYYYSWGAYNSASAGVSGGSTSSSGSSVLSFDQPGSGGRHLTFGTGNGADDDECAMWMDAAAGIGMVEHPSMAGNCHDQHGANRFGFSAPDVGLELEIHEKQPAPAKAAQKRACPGGEARASGKKQCRKSKGAKAAPPPLSKDKDPQSAAAKVRRERISEKLKVLQDLVPNGTKVDMVTMLEKAINYVKFLQLQVKVLATDEFWPAQGGKAPELSQVKDALDAILSSQHTNN